MDFVFLCFDKGTAKKPIIDCLLQYRIPFIDVGRGIYLTGDTLMLTGGA